MPLPSNFGRLNMYKQYVCIGTEKISATSGAVAANAKTSITDTNGKKIPLVMRRIYVTGHDCNWTDAPATASTTGYEANSTVADWQVAKADLNPPIILYGGSFDFRAQGIGGTATIRIAYYGATT